MSVWSLCISWAALKRDGIHDPQTHFLKEPLSLTCQLSRIPHHIPQLGAHCQRSPKTFNPPPPSLSLIELCSLSSLTSPSRSFQDKIPPSLLWFFIHGSAQSAFEPEVGRQGVILNGQCQKSSQKNEGWEEYYGQSLGLCFLCKAPFLC